MKYLFFLKRALKNNTIYRFDYYLGCLNVCIQIFISCEIWKALYITNHVSGKVSLNVVLTSFIINLGLSNIYSIDDLTVQRKFCDGTIICELLKPINYRIYLLADTVGNILFKLLFNLIPCSAIMIIVYRNYFIFCINSCSLCVFFLSIILGFMVLWEISSIVQMLCFWIVNVWSISTIKDVFINVLAGTILPVWYLPEAIQNIIKYTPFAAIYITPLKIYLNQMGTKQQIEALLMQLIWIIILALFGNLLWHMGKKKLVVQGG
ncbi:ABC transporter permease [Agathobacter rectalis]|uniref:ABC transporter permease n=1 Tax=Agathobacter rectalis TaxID=39491 RepID=UPI00321AF658